jgi:hypothetical protein
MKGTTDEQRDDPLAAASTGRAYPASAQPGPRAYEQPRDARRTADPRQQPLTHPGPVGPSRRRGAASERHLQRDPDLQRRPGSSAVQGESSVEAVDDRVALAAGHERPVDRQRHHEPTAGDPASRCAWAPPAPPRPERPASHPQVRSPVRGRGLRNRTVPAVPLPVHVNATPPSPGRSAGRRSDRSSACQPSRCVR